MNDNLPDEKEYKKYNYKLTPFKLCVLENFPFIEADFDAITNYQLLCKVVEYLNHVIDNQNTVEDNFKIMADNLNTLYNYIDTLDLQDEVNNKLDEMADSGQLTEIISLYLNSKAIFAYNNLDELKQANNLVNGSIVRTLGYYSLNDGGGALYIVKDTTPSKYYISLENDLYLELIYDDTLDVRKIGCKNGIDNSPIIKDFISKHGNNPIELLFINNTFTFNKSNESISLPDKTIISGLNATIHFNDDTNSGVSLFSGADDYLEIKNINISSTFDTITSQTNSNWFYYNTQNNIVNIENINVSNIRSFFMGTLECNYVTIRNSSYNKVGRDCNRFLKAKKSIVENCKFIECGDDIISCHGDVSDSTHYFKNNYIERSYGAGYLGGKNIYIIDNTFILPFMIAKCGYDGTEGGNTENIIIKNNIIKQPAHITGTGRNLTNFYQNTNNVYFENNKILDGDVSSINCVNIGVINNNASLDKGMSVIYTTSTINYLSFKNNYSNAPTGLSAQSYGGTSLLKGTYNMVDFYNNKIENFYTLLASGVKNNWNIENNYFNGDTQHLLSTDGIFSSSTILRVFSPYPANFKNNILRNLSGNYGFTEINTILYQPDGKYMNPIDNNAKCLYLPYDEETGLLLNKPVRKSQNMPTEGYYHYGDYVERNYTGDNQPIGWYRLTTGNSHVDNVDWKAIYPKITSE